MATKSNELLTLPGKITAVSLELPPRLSYDEWKTNLFKTVMLERFARFAIGDALCYGKANFHEKYVQAASETGLKEDTIRTYEYVAEQTLKVRSVIRIRLWSLDHWSLCREVASYDFKDQKKWLERCEKNKWTVQELRDELTAAGLRKVKKPKVERESIDLRTFMDPLPPPPDHVVALHSFIQTSKGKKLDCKICGKEPNHVNHANVNVDPTKNGTVCPCCGERPPTVAICKSCLTDLMHYRNVEQIEKGKEQRQ